MKQISFIIIVLVIVLIPSLLLAEENDKAKKNKVLNSLKYGNEILLISDFSGPVKGTVIAYENDSLQLGAIKQKPTLPRRKLNYKPRLDDPKWVPLQSKLTIPYESIQEIRVKGNAMVTGGIIGGSFFGVISFLYLSFVDAFNGMECSPSFDCGANNDELSTTEFIAGMTIGTSIGVLTGGFIGSLFHKWKLKYRETGFSNSSKDITLSPYLTLKEQPSINNKSPYDFSKIKVQIGFNINW